MNETSSSSNADADHGYNAHARKKFKQGKWKATDVSDTTQAVETSFRQSGVQAPANIRKLKSNCKGNEHRDLMRTFEKDSTMPPLYKAKATPRFYLVFGWTGQGVGSGAVSTDCARPISSVGIPLTSIEACRRLPTSICQPHTSIAKCAMLLAFGQTPQFYCPAHHCSLSQPLSNACARPITSIGQPLCANPLPPVANPSLLFARQGGTLSQHCT